MCGRVVGLGLLGALRAATVTTDAFADGEDAPGVVEL